jgi:hypothetical protein
LFSPAYPFRTMQSCLRLGPGPKVKCGHNYDSGVRGFGVFQCHECTAHADARVLGIMWFKPLGYEDQDPLSVDFGGPGATINDISTGARFH